MTDRSAQPRMAFIPIADGARAKAFYGGVLGLSLIEETPFAIVYAGPGGDLRLAKTPEFTPQPFTLVGWVVADIAGEMQSLATKGVNFERYAHMEQDDYGVWTVPDGAKICWFKDPDGNLLSLTQPA